MGEVANRAGASDQDDGQSDCGVLRKLLRIGEGEQGIDAALIEVVAVALSGSNAARVSIWRLDSSRQTLLAVRSRSLDDQLHPKPEPLLRNRDSSYFAVMEKGQVLFASEVNHPAVFREVIEHENSSEIASIVGFPIWFSGQIDGCVRFDYRDAVETWSQEAMDLGRAVADAVVRLLSGAACPSVERRTSGRDELLRKQNEILLKLAQSEAIDSGDTQLAFREITEAASEGLDIERVGVWLYADDAKDAMSSPDLFLRSERAHNTAPILSHTDFPVYFEELAKERVIPASDAHTHPATSSLSEAYLTPLGIGSLLDAPIRYRGKMAGIVCHEHVGPPRTWTQEEINFAGSVADAAGRALLSAERRMAREELERANLHLESRIKQRTKETAVD